MWLPDQVCQYEGGRGCGHQIKSVSMRVGGVWPPDQVCQYEGGRGVATRSSMSV